MLPLAVVLTLGCCGPSIVGGFVVGFVGGVGDVQEAMRNEQNIDLTSISSQRACDDEVVVFIDGEDNIWIGRETVAQDIEARLAKIDTCVLLRISTHSTHGKLVFVKDTLYEMGVESRIEIVSGD